MKNDRKQKQRANRQIVGTIFFFSLLFFCMIAYMVYFILVQAPDLMGSPYNSRMDVFNNRYIRGELLANDGQVLARTDVAEDGTETRVYPLGSLFAHVVGYSTKGKTGLEAVSNFYLMKSNMNPLTQVVNELTEQKSQGDNVVTTLDVGLQKTVSDALGDRRGAVVCMEPGTGKILAMVSKPGYDPNSLLSDWDSLTSDSNTSGNLLNRAAQGLYPPGSTFKILVALEYMREHPTDYQDFRFDCQGYYQDPDNPELIVHCYDNEEHGTVDLETAFADSCNGAFAKLGTEIDAGKLRELAESLYFNEDLPVAITSSQSRFKVTENADVWTMMQTAIGQGETMMSPLHNLLITSAIANGGVLQEPTLLERIESADGKLVKSFGEGETKQLMSSEEAAVLASFMRKVVTDGTASKLQTDDYAAAGKTGSAEYSDSGSIKTYAWFTGFAPLESPQLAVCVLVEDGETGGRTAAPIARAAFDYWLNR